MSKKHYIIPIFVPHIGCPHTCVFCNQDSITGDAGIAGSTGNVDGEFVRNTIEEYLETINSKDAVVEVSFFGGTFTGIDMCKQRELLAVAQSFKSLGKIDYIHMSTRPDYIDKDIMEHLKSFDVDVIELGVQSLDDEVLHKSGRGHSIKDVIEASMLIKEYGFTLGHQLMLGLPGDSKEKDIESVKKSVSMKPDIARIYPSLVIKDTPMEKMLKRGEYRPYSLEEAVEVSKIVYGIYEINGVNVIRIGLQPTEEINENGDVVEGPFHPAFRELVESSVYCDIIEEYIKNHGMVESVFINPREISKLYANKKTYFKRLLKELDLKEITIIQSEDVKKGSLKFYDGSQFNIVNQHDYMKSKYAYI